MKKIQLITLMLAALITTNFCYAQQNSEWKEMDAFTALVGKTLHPAERGNLQPVKDSAAVLLAKAKRWQASVIPGDYKKEETKKSLQELLDECIAIKKAVDEKVADNKLKQLVMSAHDTFHHIIGVCKIK